MVRRRVVLVVAAAVLLVVAACSSSSKSASTTSSSTSSTTTSTSAPSTSVATPSGSSSSSTTVHVATTSPAFVAGPLTTSWEGHGRVITVQANGAFTISYRLYNDCSTDPAPCDSFKGNEIYPGGSVTGVFDAGHSPRWTGRITKAADTAAWPVGPVSADYDAGTGILSVQPGLTASSEAMTFCGPSAPGACGA